MFSYKPINKIKKAFTLVEVLVALLIVGVVSSIVIPTIINDTQNQEYAVLLKKDVGTLSQASKMLMMNNGGTLAGLFNNEDDMQDKFGNYIVFTKKCTWDEPGCFYEGTNTWKTLHGDYGWLNHSSYPTAILSNNAIVMFYLDQSDCEYSNGIGPIQHSCGWMHIDVNGFKGPNVLGRDLFGLWITKTGIYPFGIVGDWYSDRDIYCKTDNATFISGRGCAAKVLSGGSVD